MRERTGNIWTWQAEHRWVVVPTNIGWKRNGENPMGAGVASQASRMYPNLAAWYGKRCKKYRENTAVCHYLEGNLILFPTKPFNVMQPWLSWQTDADLGLITRGAIQLQQLGLILEERKLIFGEIALPLLGCGEGNLSRREVVPILQAYLDDRFVLLEQS